MIHLLLRGCCGQYDLGVLDGAANLLHVLVGSGKAAKDTEGHVVSALQQEYFVMGDASKTLTLGVLSACAQKTCSRAHLLEFLEQIWNIHRAKDAESLPSSDVVQHFLQRFGRDYPPVS